MASGIYAITNTITGYSYVGKGVDIAKRWQEHKYALRANTHHNAPLQTAWNTDGESAFTFEILEYCSRPELLKRERHFIDQYSAAGECYNVRKSASARRLGSGKVTRFTKAEMLEMLNQHDTLANVAKLLGVSEASVSRFCSENGIKRITIWEDLKGVDA